MCVCVQQSMLFLYLLINYQDNKHCTETTPPPPLSPEPWLLSGDEQYNSRAPDVPQRGGRLLGTGGSHRGQEVRHARNADPRTAQAVGLL